jgi:uncharacterized phage-associated protein
VRYKKREKKMRRKEAMCRAIDVAAYLCQWYKDAAGETIQEEKLHQLLYFAQRESFEYTNKPLFNSRLEVWQGNVVCPEVRLAYYKGRFVVPLNNISEQSKYITRVVILEYGSQSSWKLREILSHEGSWKEATANADAAGKGVIDIQDIRHDALWDVSLLAN